MNHPTNRKKLIISLITDDLINQKLVGTLSELNFDTGPYMLNLSDTIIRLMGFNGEQNQQMFEHYIKLLQRARFVDNTENNQGFITLAQEIYQRLHN